MNESQLTRVRRRLRDERGMALVMAIGVTMVLAIIGSSLVLYSSSNERTANRSRVEQRTYQLAQAGIENAVSQLAQLPATSRNTATAFDALTKSQTFGTGESVTWTAALTDDYPDSPDRIQKPRWHFTSTATVPSASSTGNVVRTVSADVRLKPKTTQTLDADSWRYVYSKESNDPDGCDMELPNNPNVHASFYVSGTLCLDNNSSILGPLPGDPPVNVVIRENAVLLKNGNDLGTAARPLTSIAVEGQAVPGYPLGGCSFRGNPYNKPCTAADHVRGPSTSGSSPITGPVANFSGWYDNASPGPLSFCENTTSLPSATFFDTGDGVPNGSAGTVDLGATPSFTCQTAYGELSWNAATRVLTVAGTIFIDGNLDLSSAGTIDYNGSAALYLSGWFHMRQTLLCAIVTAGACDATAWEATPTDVLLVLGNANYNFGPSCTSCSALLEQSAVMQGALYGENDLGFQNNSYIQGPMVSNQEIIQNSFTFNYIPPLIRVPFGTPGNTTTEWELTPPTNYTG